MLILMTVRSINKMPTVKRWAKQIYRRSEIKITPHNFTSTIFNT